MAKAVRYAPVFRGQFPTGARSRWSAINRFIDQWCLPGDAAQVKSGERTWPLVQSARQHCDGELSFSIRQWLILVERALPRGAPHIRDCPVVEPLAKHVDDPAAQEATVILISGESDVFWAVATARLMDDDPPVEVFQSYDPSSPAWIGQVDSVSEFALKYLCLYNEFAVGNREWFSALGTADDVDAMRQWFDDSLVFDADDGWCDYLGIFESQDAAAIARRERLDVSLFRNPAELNMPPFLQAQMESHLALRRQYQSPS